MYESWRENLPRPRPWAVILPLALVVPGLLLGAPSTVGLAATVDRIDQLIESGQFEEAREAAQRALDTVERIHGRPSQAWIDATADLLDAFQQPHTPYSEDPVAPDWGWSEFRHDVVRFERSHGRTPQTTRLISLLAYNDAIRARTHADVPARDLLNEALPEHLEAVLRSQLVVGIMLNKERSTADALGHLRAGYDLAQRCSLAPCLALRVQLADRLGESLDRSGLVEQALEVCEESLASIRRRYGSATPRALHQLARCQAHARRLDRNERVVEAYERGLEALRHRPDMAGFWHPELAAHAGTALIRLSRLADARDVAERALTFDPADTRSSGRPHLLLLAATSCSMLGDFASAGSYAARARELLEQQDDLYSQVLLGIALLRQARIQNALGEHRKALRTLDTALAQIELHSHTTPDAKPQLLVLNLAAMIHLELGELDAAESRLRQGIPAADLAQGRITQQTQEIWETRAWLLDRRGEHREAARIARKIVARIEQRRGGLFLVSPLVTLSEALHHAGDQFQAFEAVDRAIDVLEELGLTQSVRYVRAVDLRARIHRALGQVASGTTDALDAARIKTELIRLYAQSLPESQVLSVSKTLPRPEAVLVEAALADGRPQDTGAFAEYAMRRRGLVLDEVAERHRLAVRLSSVEARQAWRRLEEARGRLASLFVRALRGNDDPELLEQLQGAVDAREQAEAAVSRFDRRFRERREQSTTSLGDVLDVLKRHSAALVQYLRIDRADGGHYVAIVLNYRTATARVFDLGVATAIDDLIGDYRDALHASRSARMPMQLDDLLRRSAAVREKTWDPLVASVAGTELVYIVPDGGLELLILADLVDDRGRFLIESAPPMRTLSSPRDLLAIHRVAKGDAALLVGDPDYGASGTVRRASLSGTATDEIYRGIPASCELRSGTWRALPGTRAELTEVRTVLEPTLPIVTRTGSQASEEQFRRDIRGKRFIHLATHGYFLSRTSCSLAPSAPLLRSGIILAGANHSERSARGDDGFLTAEELLHLDASSAELVVLSGCDTGRGDIAVDEGVLGLRRALQIAGAQQVLMSLTPVSDRWSVPWMRAFYSELSEGAAAHDALRRASLTVLEDLRANGRAPHPFLWGSFVLSGPAVPD